MGTRRPPRSPRTARSSEMMQRVERSRERVRRRRELARERDRATAAAVRRYLADWQAISACEAKRDAEVAELHRQIGAVEDEAAQKIAGLRADQGGAAMTIRDQPGHTDDDVADLLEITPKQVRQLIMLARATVAAPTAASERNQQNNIGSDRVVVVEQITSEGTQPPCSEDIPTREDDAR